MTDDRSESSAHTDDDSGESEGNTGAPGGGPRRVVSNRSVDDVLDSLGSPDDDASRDDGASRTTAPDASNEHRDAIEPDAAEADGDANSDESDRSDEASDESSIDRIDETESDALDGTESETADVDDSEAEASDATDADDRATRSDTDGDASDSDAAASHANDDADPALSARIESGAVTGADVRAAEAGEGRERTPEVDEIDLSMDDVEGTTIGTSGVSATPRSDAGPLAGAIGPNAESDSAAADRSAPEDEGSADDDGFFARLRGLFSR